MRTIWSNIVFIVFFLVYHTKGGPQCGDGWTMYRDEKCFKIVDDLVDHEFALAVCGEQATSSSIPFLLSIESPEEQEFVTKFVFEDSGIIDNVWLGAVRNKENENEFQWADGSKLDYSNWHEGNPTNITDHDCTIMMPKGIKQDSRVLAEDGLWADALCMRRNVVVCQKIQSWSLEQVQKTILDVRKNMIKNPVPIGFIYVQLPFKPEPSEIWDSVIFQEVTSEYAGLFFRAEGGNSEPFEVEQTAFAPRISAVNYADCKIGSPECPQRPAYPWSINLPQDGKSEHIMVGSFTWTENHDEGIQFTVEGGETRPRNMAIRIWERIK